MCHSGQCKLMYNSLELGIYLPSLGLMMLVCSLYIFLGCRKAKKENDTQLAAVNGDYVLMEGSHISFGQKMVCKETKKQRHGGGRVTFFCFNLLIFYFRNKWPSTF